MIASRPVPHTAYLRFTDGIPLTAQSAPWVIVVQQPQFLPRCHPQFGPPSQHHQHLEGKSRLMALVEVPPASSALAVLLETVVQSTDGVVRWKATVRQVVSLVLVSVVY